MLSSVLNSPRAIQVNIQIIRTFTKLREMISSYIDLRQKIKDMEKQYDSRFKVVFDAIKYLLKDEREAPKRPMGFRRREGERD